ncbi:MAG: homoserine O-acetyltransferase [Bacteroidota bacterium]
MEAIKVQQNTKTFHTNSPFILESGNVLEDLTIRYTTYGQLNKTKTNVVWVFHALTANSDPVEWWPGVVGEGEVINPDEHFIVCANMLGSCYGTTGPKNSKFPLVTITDMVDAHKLLKKHLGISKIHLGIGGSMGGQQLLEWAVQEPELFEKIVPLATNAFHSPWGIAFNEAQRMALENIDPSKGLETARAIAMLSYRNYKTYGKSQKDVDQRWDHFSASSYQRYQGEKLRKRFTLESYYILSKAMDSHHLGRNFGSAEAALKRIKSEALVIGIDSDILFPLHEQKFIADHIENSRLVTFDSDYGHDGFLIEAKQLSELLKNFL